MRRFVLLLLILPVFILAGCAGHSSRHTERYHVQACRSFPCGDQVEYHDMEFDWELQRDPSGEYTLSGTLTPLGVPEGATADLAVMSFELARDLTIVDSFSFPIVSPDMRFPLKFRHRFTTSQGFDGLTFNWDLHIKE